MRDTREECCPGGGDCRTGQRGTFVGVQAGASPFRSPPRGTRSTRSGTGSSARVGTGSVGAPSTGSGARTRTRDTDTGRPRARSTPSRRQAAPAAPRRRCCRRCRCRLRPGRAARIPADSRPRLPSHPISLPPPPPPSPLPAAHPQPAPVVTQCKVQTRVWTLDKL